MNSGHLRNEFSEQSCLWLLGIMLCLALPLTGAASQSGDLALENLRCEYRVDPVGIDVVLPRLSWTLASGLRGQRQTAFQVLVASSPAALARNEGNRWDSGRVSSDQTVHVVYAGQPLESRMRACWKVRVWDKDGQPSAWSPTATWTMGLLRPADWRAQWIADPTVMSTFPTRAPLRSDARGPRNGYHSAMAGSADTLKWVALDLGQVRSFDAVRLFPARPYDVQPDTPGYLFPVRFRIEAAALADFSDARVLLDRTAGDEPNPGTDTPLYRFASTEARFVRLAVTRLGRRAEGQFAFTMAEMVVQNENRSLAYDAPVLALDSLETRLWSTINLTDGITMPVKPGEDPGGVLPATMLRKAFALDPSIKRATAYVSALGVYELRLNGRRVGEQLLAPEWTSYRQRVHYQTHDVTALLHPGENAVAALVGEGWYAGRLEGATRLAYGTQPRFLLQLEVECADGRVQTIVTDGSWHCTTDGPIRASGIYDGEAYDARQDMPGWDAPDFNAQSWRPVQSVALDAKRLVWQRNEPIQVEMEITPVQMTEPRPGVFVFDFGQNLVGWCRVQAVGADGRTVTLRHGEWINDDGSLYTGNLRRALQTDSYTPVASGEFVFEPHFTYHGFRFLELTGLAQRPTAGAVRSRVFRSASPLAGRFECSDPRLGAETGVAPGGY